MTVFLQISFSRLAKWQRMLPCALPRPVPFLGLCELSHSDLQQSPAPAQTAVLWPERVLPESSGPVPRVLPSEKRPPCSSLPWCEGWDFHEEKGVLELGKKAPLCKLLFWLCRVFVAASGIFVEEHGLSPVAAHRGFPCCSRGASH